MKIGCYVNNALWLRLAKIRKSLQRTNGSTRFLQQNIAQSGFYSSFLELSDIRLNDMGFVFQQMHMLRNLSVYDNIILSAYNSKQGRGKEQREQINARAKQLMRELGIIEVAENDITEVSGGQLQRACICRAMINNPKVLFADEPTGALNSKVSIEVMEQFNRINQEGTTILLITHDAKVAARADKVLYIMDGNIQGEFVLGKYEGPEQLKQRQNSLNNWLRDMGW